MVMSVVCPRCGRGVEVPPGLPPGQPFGCPLCGNMLAGQMPPAGGFAEASQGGFPQQPPGAFPQAGPPVAAGMPGYPSPYGPPVWQAAPRRRLGPILAVVAAVVLAGGGGTAAWFLFLRGDKAATAAGGSGAAAAGPVAQQAGGTVPGGAQAPTDSGRAPSKDAQKVMFDALQFREAVLFDFDGAVTLHGAGDAFAALTSRPPPGGERALWPLFFAGALTLAGNMHGERPVVCYYNPLFDAALLTTWEVRDGTARIVAVALRPGADIGPGGGGGGPLVRWMVSPKPLTEALPEQTAAFAAAFERAYPPEGEARSELPAPAIPPEAIDGLEGLLFVVLTQLQFLHDPSLSGIGAVVGEMRGILAGGDKEALARALPARNPVSADDLLHLPLDARTEVRPVYAVVSERKLLVFLASTSAPGVLGVYEFALDGGRAEARSLIFFDVTTPRREG